MNPNQNVVCKPSTCITHWFCNFFIYINMLLLKDIDECQDSSTCDHNCTNKEGSFTCSCAVGYRLGNDGKSCTGTECF